MTNIKIHNTGDATIKPSVVMLVYGQGGIGKSTFCATAPNPIMADCENGSKYFGLRGISIDVMNIETWTDMLTFFQFIKTSLHETVIIDPIGDLMTKLKKSIIETNNKKFVMGDGGLTMAGWGELKDRMRQLIKAIRDTNKHIIIVAHIDEKDDEGRLVKRPKVETKLSEELVAIVDVVGFMELVKSKNPTTGEMEDKRIIRVAPNDKYESKDRTGQLGGIIEPDFQKIINACQGNEKYSWSSATAVVIDAPQTLAQPAQTATGQAETTQPDTSIKSPAKVAPKAKSAQKTANAVPMYDQMLAWIPKQIDIVIINTALEKAKTSSHFDEEQRKNLITMMTEKVVELSNANPLG